MIRGLRLLAVLLMASLLVGCGDPAPTPVATDPDSVKKLEELQKQGGKSEKR